MTESTRTRRRVKLRRWRVYARRIIRQHILGLDDTPHRIAFGVFLGFVIGATPTLGFQIIIYLAVSWILRANHASGIPPIMLSNPLTAVPLYYGNWRVGRFVLQGSATPAGDGLAAIESLSRATETTGGFWSSLFSAEYWQQVGTIFWNLGFELWVGSLIVGVIAGLIAYPIAHRAVVSHRVKSAQRKSRRQGRASDSDV